MRRCSLPSTPEACSYFNTVPHDALFTVLEMKTIYVFGADHLHEELEKIIPDYLHPTTNEIGGVLGVLQIVQQVKICVLRISLKMVESGEAARLDGPIRCASDS
ncbi:hypothetical protein J6590_067202 [Homalodisca vitripennis]|nr:hypothetical protein J6590_067202 [Homalodisca vitripennis]